VRHRRVVVLGALMFAAAGDTATGAGAHPGLSAGACACVGAASA
jgi:hypothetical protein